MLVILLLRCFLVCLSRTLRSHQAILASHNIAQSFTIRSLRIINNIYEGSRVTSITYPSRFGLSPFSKANISLGMVILPSLPILVRWLCEVIHMQTCL